MKKSNRKMLPEEIMNSFLKWKRKQKKKQVKNNKGLSGPTSTSKTIDISGDWGE